MDIFSFFFFLFFSFFVKKKKVWDERWLFRLVWECERGVYSCKLQVRVVERMNVRPPRAE